MAEKPRSRADLSAVDVPAPAPRWVRWIAYGLVIGFFASILTCGYVAWLAKPIITNDPEFAQFTAENILRFTPAAGYLPKGAIEWPMLSLLKMRAAYFEKPDVDGMLVLIEVGSDFVVGNERVEKHVEAMLREKNGISDALQVEPRVARETVIANSREREFELSLAKDPITGVRYRLIEGVVSSIMGKPVFVGVRYRIDANASDSDPMPDDIRKMLESIK